VQTFPSHALLGVLVGEIAVTAGMTAEYHPSVIWFVAFLGAIAPDMVMVPMFVRDKLEGRQPMTMQGPITMMLKEMSHSIPLWVGLLIGAFWISDPMFRDFAVLFLVAGIFGGVLPDVPTHAEERFRETDCSFLYPFGGIAKMLFGIDAIRWPSDKWEYRIDHGVLWPLKDWERDFNYIVGALILFLLLLLP